MGHELTVTLPPRAVDLDADPTRLAQVFGNLLNNAAKYTDRGRPHLADRRAAGRRRGRCPVRDTGIGIAADLLPRIFEMFTQVDRSLERSQGGLGIGLTLVQAPGRDARRHGRGPQRRAGPGAASSSCACRSPCEAVRSRRPPAGDGEPAAAASARGASWSWTTTGTRPTAWRCCCGCMGNEVRTAHDGLEAVEAAAAFRPDVVLLDIGLPKLNGYEAAAASASSRGASDVSSIALTGWGQEEDRAARTRPGSTTTWSSRWTPTPCEAAGRGEADPGHEAPQALFAGEPLTPFARPAREPVRPSPDNPTNHRRRMPATARSLPLTPTREG